MTVYPTFTLAGDATAIMRVLDQATITKGWEYRGSHGVFCDGRNELYGYTFAGPNGEYVSLDFTRNVETGKKRCLVAGLPTDLGIEMVA